MCLLISHLQGKHNRHLLKYYIFYLSHEIELEYTRLDFAVSGSCEIWVRRHVT